MNQLNWQDMGGGRHQAWIAGPDGSCSAFLVIRPGGEGCVVDLRYCLGGSLGEDVERVKELCQAYVDRNGPALCKRLPRFQLPSEAT
jgi:hypothetical protein